MDSRFGPFLSTVAADFIYNVSSAVIDDDELENDEGFILYFAFNRSVINPVDLARLNVGTGAILVTIEDDDGILLFVPYYKIH